jgi:hypothetical protein
VPGGSGPGSGGGRFSGLKLSLPNPSRSPSRNRRLERRSKMKARFVVGYILLFLGIFGSIMMAFEFISRLLAPPTGNLGEALAAGLAWAGYVGCSIFIIPGSILIRKHKSVLKIIISIIVILLGIIPQTVAYVHNLPYGPSGPTIENLLFFLIPFVLYMIPGILLIM